MELAQCLIDELECELESTLALADKMLLANYVYLLITQQQYDVKKMNLILVCDSGIWLSRLLEERLRARYGELIDRVERMELYEARSVNFEDYDAVVMVFRAPATATHCHGATFRFCLTVTRCAIFMLLFYLTPISFAPFCPILQ